MKKFVFLLIGVLLMVAPTVITAQDAVTLKTLWPEGSDVKLQVDALTAAYQKAHPNVTFEIEYRPGGADGDNIVKTRLATGEMADVFQYNSGSLLQALNPTQTLVDLTGQPFMKNVVESFLPTVSQGDKVFGVPFGTALGGGILYNKAIFEKLGLKVPTTWDEFAANNDVIAKAGIPPVLATFGDTWTSQLFVLADYYNVEQANPGFAESYTNNKAKYADIPAALAGFEHQEQAFKSGWFQKDFATTKYEQGLGLLAKGEVAQYPMLSFAIQNIAANNPDALDNIGFFAQPGTSADHNGATIWMPGGLYVPQTTDGAKRESALDFLGFIASTEAVDIMNSVVPPGGPFLIVGAKLPDNVPPAVQEVAAYIDSGNSYPALEFVSPIKGPNLEQLLVAVGTGQMTAKEAAANYDLDVQRQAQQLGIPGW